ncbi:MAG: sugar ABC transporter permease [Candidatus Caldatribacterium sp.]|nr:sugar ABC transporter permease [Candidatus Caldatribacterium sp.]
MVYHFPVAAHWWKTRRRLAPYAFVTPALLLLAVFTFYPVARAFILGLCKWDVLEVPVFVGFRNYSEILQDPAFWDALSFTFRFVLVTVPLNLLLALVSALLLNGDFPLKGFFRSLIFFPAFTSLVAIGMVWRYMYSTDYGIANYFLTLLGLTPKGWLSDLRLAPWSTFLVAIWYGYGWNTVIFLAGLQGIPREYHEAAAIDGATEWQRLRFITLPLLWPVTFFVLTMALIYAFRTFDLVYVLTQGGPGRATLIYMMYFYKVAFVAFQMGKACASAFILFLIILVITLLQFRFIGRIEAGE